jgi:hypothetical protein
MACTYLSGKDGTVYLSGAEVAHMRNFNVDASVNIDAFNTNSTSGWNARVPGVKDATGTFEWVLPVGFTSTPLDVGDCVAGQFHVDGTGSNYWSGRIVIESEGVPVDVTAGGAIVFSYGWGSDGALTKNGGLVKSGS